SLHTPFSVLMSKTRHEALVVGSVLTSFTFAFTHSSYSGYTRAPSKSIPTKKSSSITAITLPSCSNGEKPILYITDQEDCAPPSNIEPFISGGSVGKCLF